MSLARAQALADLSPRDPRRALREAEGRHARKEILAIAARNAALGTPTKRTAVQKSSAAPFGSSVQDRFEDILTRDPTPGTAPGAYEQTHATVATLVANKFNPFEFGTNDSRLLERALANAGGTEEGLQSALSKLHDRPRGWMRGDYHRWLTAQVSSAHLPSHLEGSRTSSSPHLHLMTFCRTPFPRTLILAR